MHEVGIMESALTVVQRHAAERKARRVDRIVLRIGTLAGVEPEALRFAFDVVTRGTVAEGAVLAIENAPARVYCPACEREFTGEADSFIFTCPDCHALCGEVRSGRELELSRIEMS
ncbi:MAG: hydrogenase maturation nickel metallochaperone HypA [Opitutaceae bacterium]|nr:hydrogenase maturation nickel metallochaperone HypA [Opitutaceae bacterium]